MRKFLLAMSAIAALVIAAPAGAADLKARPMAPPPPSCAQFGGFYAGVQAGSVYYQNTFNDLDFFWNGASTTVSDLSWHAGVQGGYNWQTGCTMFGVMADWSWSNAKVDTLLSCPGCDATFRLRSELDGFGTLRARTGIVVQNLLLYVSGGVAGARFDRTIDIADELQSCCPVFATFEHKKTRWGWAAGAGTEWSFTPNLSLMGEFVLMGFNKHEGTFIDPVNFDPFRFSNQDIVLVSRIGLNYRFGGASYGGGYY
jgi:outer membrane immunogenic protein